MTHRMMARRIAPFRYFILQHRARHFGVSCRLVVSSLFFRGSVSGVRVLTS